VRGKQGIYNDSTSGKNRKWKLTTRLLSHKIKNMSNSPVDPKENGALSPACDLVLITRTIE
jgi:hypothetical protein